MREIQELRGGLRTGAGKGPAYQTRQKGLVPAIIYGGTKEQPQPIAVPRRELERYTFTGTFLTTLLMLDIDGKKTRVLPRQIQLDPVSDRPVHVDFMRLEKGATITLNIPVRFKGHEASPGLKRGGVLNIVRHQVELTCPAENIPEFIEGDLSGLEILDGTLKFTLPEGVPHHRARPYGCHHCGPDQRHRRTARRRAAADAPAEAEEATTKTEGEGEPQHPKEISAFVPCPPTSSGRGTFSALRACGNP